MKDHQNSIDTALFAAEVRADLAMLTLQDLVWEAKDVLRALRNVDPSGLKCSQQCVDAAEGDFAAEDGEAIG